MISVQRVFEVVRDLCNKDQKGFVSPNVFNTFARVAQQNIYNEMFNELKLAVALRRSGRDAGRDKSGYKTLEEDLSTYIQNLIIAADTDGVYEDFFIDPVTGEVTDVETDQIVTVLTDDVDGAFTFNRPADFGKLISMSLSTDNTPVEIIHDAEKAARVLNSNLSAPTDAFPVALEMSGVYQVFPSSVGEVRMVYYRQPRALRFDGTYEPQQFPQFVPLNGVGDLLIADPNNCRNFDLPEHYINEVVSEIVKMIGVRLRDKDLAAYGLQQTQAE